MDINAIDPQFKYQRILIVDDDVFNLKSAIIILKAAARKLGRPEQLIDEIVDEAMNGVEAMEFIQRLYDEEKQSYGLVITDLSMPHIDGYKTC